MFSDDDPDFVRACQQERERLLDNIKCYEQRITSCRDAQATVAERLRPRYDLAAKLRAAGFDADVSSYCEYVFVSVKREQLTDVYRVTGRLRKEYTQLVNTKKKLIEVVLSAVAHEFLRVSYQHQLQPNDRCKLVKKRIPPRVETELVCSLSPAHA